MKLDREVVKRIVRTAAAAFVGVYGASNLINLVSGTATFNASLARSAAAAAAAAVVAAIWNIVLDPSPVPSLRLKD